MYAGAFIRVNANYWSHVHFFRRSGPTATLTFGDPIVVDQGGTGNQNQPQSIPITASMGVAAFPSATVSLSTVIVARKRNKVIGLAVDATGRVQTHGMFLTSGLTPGAKYYADNNGNLTTVAGECQIGVALSATQLRLEVVPGV